MSYFVILVMIGAVVLMIVAVYLNFHSIMKRFFNKKQTKDEVFKVMCTRLTAQQDKQRELLKHLFPDSYEGTYVLVCLHQ